MSKIDFAKEFPLSHKGVIQMLKAKIRILTPPPSHLKTPSSTSPGKTTPKFTTSIEKTPDYHKQNRRITGMYKANKRAKSALHTGTSKESSRNTSRSKGYSIYSKFFF